MVLLRLVVIIDNVVPFDAHALGLHGVPQARRKHGYQHCNKDDPGAGAPAERHAPARAVTDTGHRGRNCRDEKRRACQTEPFLKVAPV